MRVFKPKYTDRQGQKQQAEKWYVEFRDHLERIRRLPAFPDKRQSEELGRKILNLVAGRANNEAPTRDQRKWLEGLPSRIRDKLAALGIVEAERAAAAKTLDKHVDDFEKALIAKGNTEQHARQVTGRARRLFKSCGCRVWSDVSASKVERRLATMREGERGISRQTSNFYVQAAKQFCRWMVDEGRAAEFPLSRLKMLNVDTDRRHDRRALSVEELRWLLSVTADGPEREGIPGAERALVYRLASETGLRAAEVRSLTRGSFDFACSPATVTVEAGYSKRRRRDVLPLRPGMVERLAAHLAAKLPDAPAFKMSKRERVAHLMRADLAAAREKWLQTPHTAAERREREKTEFLVYRDSKGLVADFHALRHGFITNLAQSGVHPKVAQELARHSTITLTMDRYTHSRWEDMGEALAKLPDLSPVAHEAQQATGTDGRAAEMPPSVLAFCLAQSDAPEGHSVRRDALKATTGDVGAHGEQVACGPRDTAEINGGSASESNRPAARLTHGTTILKTAATTRCACTSKSPVLFVKGPLNLPVAPSCFNKLPHVRAAENPC